MAMMPPKLAMSREYECALPGSLFGSVLVPRLFQVCFYGLHEGKDPILHVKVAFLMVHHQADVHMPNALVLFIGEKHNEYSSGTAVHIWLDTLWLEGVVINQALQIGKGDPLHVQGAPWQHKADVPEAEGLIAGHHVPGQRLQTLEVVRKCSQVENGHLQEQKQKD